MIITRVLTNSKFLTLTPTFSKVPIDKYGKTPNFSSKQHFYSYFQNPSENSDYARECDFGILRKKQKQKKTKTNLSAVFLTK